MIVDKQRTELRIDNMLNYGAAAYSDVFNQQVPTYVLAVAASQWTTECGIKPGTAKYVDGGKIIYSIWNNNWGNITCKASADCDKFALTTNERISKNPDVWKTLTLYYKSYPTARHGAIDYWSKMKESFPKSLKSFNSGFPKLIAETLSKEGYYTALVETYSKNLEYFFPRYVRLLTTGKEI